MRTLLATSLAFLALAWVIPASAQDAYPTLTGTWKGPADRIVLHRDDSEPTYETKPLTLVVKGQRDRRFYGAIEIVERKQTLMFDLAGIFTSQNTFSWAEPDGLVQGRMIDSSTIEACYLRISTFSQAAACETLKRQN